MSEENTQPEVVEEVEESTGETVEVTTEDPTVPSDEEAHAFSKKVFDAMLVRFRQLVEANTPVAKIREIMEKRKAKLVPLHYDALMEKVARCEKQQTAMSEEVESALEEAVEGEELTPEAVENNQE